MKRLTHIMFIMLTSILFVSCAVIIISTDPDTETEVSDYTKYIKKVTYASEDYIPTAKGFDKTISIATNSSNKAFEIFLQDLEGYSDIVVQLKMYDSLLNKIEASEFEKPMTWGRFSGKIWYDAAFRAQSSYANAAYFFLSWTDPDTKKDLYMKIPIQVNVS